MGHFKIADLSEVSRAPWVRTEIVRGADASQGLSRAWVSKSEFKCGGCHGATTHRMIARTWTPSRQGVAAKLEIVWVCVACERDARNRFTNPIEL